MCDHDYDGLLPKSGKRHLGKTRWTREEVTNHVIKTWNRPRVYQFMKKNVSAKLQVLKLISWPFEVLPWPAQGRMLTSHHSPNVYTVPSASKLFIVLWMSPPSHFRFHLCFSLCLFCSCPSAALLLTTFLSPVKASPFLWGPPWIPQAGRMHPPGIGYTFLLMTAVTWVPPPVDWRQIWGQG